MRHYILASHGTFAEGIYQSIKIIVGEQPNVYRICAYTEGTIEISKQLQEVLEKIPERDEIIACTDMFGGSVNNEMMRYLGRKNMHLIAGMNLPLLLYMFMAKDMSADCMMKHVVTEAMSSIVYCNKKYEESIEEENF